MNKLVIVTYVFRALGFVLVLLSLFGHSAILNVFPALEGHSINPIFYTGILFYAVGAIVYFVIDKRRKALQRKEQIAEATKQAFGENISKED